MQQQQCSRAYTQDDQCHEQPLTPAVIHDTMQALVSNASPSLQNIRVTGELCNPSCPKSGHVYFDLADGEHPKKKLSCTYFCARRKCDADTLARLKKGGCCVVVYGSIRCVCEFGGSKYQLNVFGVTFVTSDRDTRDKQLQQWRKALTEEGVLDTSRKRHVPEYPRVVAIITSATGAALHDVRQTLENGHAPLTVKVYPAIVQGDTCVPSVIAQLERVCEDNNDAANNNNNRADVVLVTRGGGSSDDLWAFNDPTLVRTIDAMRATSNLPPIVCAIGHQIDTPLIDDVCDASHITPTAAAQHIVNAYATLRTTLQQRHTTHHDRIRTRVHTVAQRYHNLTHAVRTCDPCARVAHALKQHHQTCRARLQHVVHNVRARYTALCDRLHACNPLPQCSTQLHTAHAHLHKQLHTLVHDRHQRWHALHTAVHTCMPWSALCTQGNVAVLKDEDGARDFDTARLATGKRGTLVLQTASGSYTLHYRVGVTQR